MFRHLLVCNSRSCIWEFISLKLVSLMDPFVWNPLSLNHTTISWCYVVVWIFWSWHWNKSFLLLEQATQSLTLASCLCKTFYCAASLNTIFNGLLYQFSYLKKRFACEKIRKHNVSIYGDFILNANSWRHCIFKFTHISALRLQNSCFNRQQVE